MANAKHEGARVWWCALFIYWGFRILGATKKHAWERAKVATAQAVIAKVVEWSGIQHPDGIPPGHMQVTFEGGPMDRSVRTVEVCGTVEVTVGEDKLRYHRTDRKRGASTVFSLEVQQ